MTATLTATATATACGNDLVGFASTVVSPSPSTISSTCGVG
jgi:hypothetical protein